MVELMVVLFGTDPRRDEPVEPVGPGQFGPCQQRGGGLQPGDYTRTLRELPEAEWDLAISLYAGPVSEHVARCLKPGGWLLANNSHADAGLAHVNPAYRLAATVHHRAGRYRLTTDDLERYLLPRTPPHPTRDQLHATGRGVAYTHPATAYLFQRVPHDQ
ncbi:hypothetical protein [Streptomyces sp. NPDC085540]|uniref:hypothetical protein n=1 Tax=Streptomyces sp. NPDC085540 TaxID=3365730 RepID=UPI0037D72987